MRPLPPAILLMGPTASGKTAAAMALYDALPVELISVDSAQVFIDMNIGTAKPDVGLLTRYPHRLIDLITPEERYSAARFRADALAATGHHVSTSPTMQSEKSFSSSRSTPALMPALSAPITDIWACPG